MPNRPVALIEIQKTRKMIVHKTLHLDGFITQEKYVKGRSLGELERILGFHKGRFARGVKVVTLTLMPKMEDFELRGYSQVAGHRFQDQFGQKLDHLDIQKLKRMAMLNWGLMGPNRLIKILPEIRHDQALQSDHQYPPGSGIPQWLLTKKMPMTIIAECTDYPEGRLHWS